ncbi:MAG TPA: hypothetical protein VLM88_01755 [Proteiniclasticum sp.]|nr:hypothetical protein [Proteiniclasticum sp.]
MKNFIAIVLLAIIVFGFSVGLFGWFGLVLFAAIFVALAISMIMSLENRITELESKLSEISAEKGEPAGDRPSEEVTE